jgi:ABC-type glutathione transport system ATPase component
MNLLELKDATFHYRSDRSSANPSGISSINLLVESGCNLGVIGESGAGKSTLLSLLLGLTRPSSGQILFQDQPLLLENRRQVVQFRSEVQAVFQDPYASLDPRRKIERIVSEPIRSLRLLSDRSAINERVKESLNAVELEESIAHRYPHELSGGQRQRVAIARALATHPSILIADEPTSALDVSTRIEVIELLRRLGDERRLTIVMVSHDVSIVASLCKEVVVLNQGRIVEDGPIGEILANPKHDYTKKLISAVPRLPR